MAILAVLIPLGLLLLGLAIAAFVWAVRDGQFENLEGEAARILFEEDGPSRVDDRSVDPSRPGVAGKRGAE